MPLGQCPLLTLRYPASIPQPAVPPGQGPGHAAQAGEGAALVSARSELVLLNSPLLSWP